MNIFIHENAFDIVVYKMSAILSQLQCVDTSIPRIKWHKSVGREFCQRHEMVMVTEFYENPLKHDRVIIRYAVHPVK